MKASSRKSYASPHGGGIRGSDNDLRSPVFEGRFGRMFRELPPASHSESALTKLGLAMTAKPELNDKGQPAAARETSDHLQDDEENSGLAAGYTYFGQFIDHDITFDPASLQEQQNDPEAMVDYRTPRLDLDSLYGRGPADQPYMYLDNGKFRLGRALTRLDLPSNSRDLPRFFDTENPGPARALIGDKRNDENVIVSQLHGAFLQLHNRCIDTFGKSFKETQAIVRWHYQYAVVNDFLVRLCGKEMIDSILPHRLSDSATRAENRAKLQFYHWRNDPFLPLEFSVAAYRFGHSMVRPIYRLNTELDGGADPLQATDEERERGLDGRFFLFAGLNKRALNGFGEFPTPWAIDWNLFFDIDGSGRKGGKERAQPSYKIDTSLANPLAFLPEFSQVRNEGGALALSDMQPAALPGEVQNLAVRNLLRGRQRAMPSGQAVAAYMGLQPIPDRHLRICKAVIEEWETAPSITTIDPSFAGNAPLWYYVLAEAQYEWVKKAMAPNSMGDAEPLTLGPVGGRIVAETLIGLIEGDPHSYLSQHPNWVPEIGGRDLTIGKLVDFALTGRNWQ
jgi:hypothetical protein